MPTVDIEKMDDVDVARLIENRWKDSSDLVSLIEETYLKSKKQWQNDPEWISRTPPKKSKTRDNRSFLAMESQILNLTARPSKPSVIPANDSDDSKKIAERLQKWFLEKHKRMFLKKKMRKALRWLYLSRVGCLKAYWDDEADDFDFKVVDPRKVRFTRKASNPYDVDVAMEEIEATASEGLLLFDKEDERKVIRGLVGAGNDEEAFIQNKKFRYVECWIGGWTVYKAYGRNEIIKREKNPYWDSEGILLTNTETETLGAVSGNLRRTTMEGLKKLQPRRVGKKGNYRQYLFNYFDRPMHPYIFGTLFDLEEGYVGETSLMEQVAPLQQGIDKSKRQISDNASQAGGKWKVDTKFAKVTKAQVEVMKSDPEGFIYGDGVREGITIEAGRDLPSIVSENMKHSIDELDNIFGTGPTFRGEQAKTETAAGRAILREQSFQRLDEPIDFVDYAYFHIYRWCLQFIKTKYTEEHLLKQMGKQGAVETISLMRDDIEDGVEVDVIPGQILPDDRLYKADRALEAAKNAMLAPLSYFEAAGYDNPMAEAKRLEMYKTNPFSILDMTDEDIASLQRANQILQQATPQPMDPRANAVASMRDQIQQLMADPEFQNKPPEEQKRVIGELRSRFQSLQTAAPAK